MTVLKAAFCLFELSFRRIYKQLCNFFLAQIFTAIFFLSWVSFTNIPDSQDSRGRGRLSLLNSSLPLLPFASQALTLMPSDYSRKLAFAHSSRTRYLYISIIKYGLNDEFPTGFQGRFQHIVLNSSFYKYLLSAVYFEQGIDEDIH